MKLSEREVGKMFEKLDWLLSNVLLDTEETKPRTPKASEFMLMHVTEDNVVGFKHSMTRNYVYIYPGNKLYVPKNQTPFMRGFFDYE